MSLGTGASGGDKKIIISRVVVLSEEPVDNRTIAENVWMSFGFSPARHSPVTAGHIGREGRRTHTHTQREREPVIVSPPRKSGRKGAGVGKNNSSVHCSLH